MPWYIRFGKVPELAARASVSPASSSSSKKKIISSSSVSSTSDLDLSFSFEIRNDLGESLYPGPAGILVTVSHSSKQERAIQVRVQWDGQKWMQNVKIPIPASYHSRRPGSHISVYLDLEPGADNDLAVEYCTDLKRIYGTTSSSLELRAGAKAEPFATRPLPGDIRAWEGTGSSIAAHFWDAGLVLCAHLRHLALTRDGAVHELAELLLRDGQATALELGAGCGISGLVLTQQFERYSVELTDIADAQELIARNVQLAGDQRREYYALDWASSHDRSQASQRVQARDLILISDCTYNVDAVGVLVEALKAVASSQDTLIAVALKRRHQDEIKFFHDMSANGFVHIRKHIFSIPCNATEEAYGLEPKEIELHLYRPG